MLLLMCSCNVFNSMIAFARRYVFAGRPDWEYCLSLHIFRTANLHFFSLDAA
jgi:hypothetical protein